MCDRSCHDVGEDKEGGDPSSQPTRIGFGEAERQHTKADINEQGDDLGGQPRGIEWRVPELPSEPDGADEQQGIDAVWCNFYPALSHDW